ncbi:armadillo repeat-containing protein 2 isoform X1 [Bufo gargarizans]|uniref:armadillo repeat-containing protein 2 isoform X1 n=1 Tax=Bufo gargarizans TaxID=30331 RepID=UPI001CF413F9|nr:armadillo repeat-containing protein 2 isoform X1 [Bufo gargarizans]
MEESKSLQKMSSSRDKRSDPFYKPPNSVQKTSAEIINEARNSLRTLKTKRPFTPREDQRKLFGPLSSRTPDNRPPSSFSLHSCSFESPESRPLSGTRLSPLPHKPKLPSLETEDEITPAAPQPPPHAVPSRRPSRTRTHLLRSHGNILAESGIHQVEGKSLNGSKETLLLKDTSEEDRMSLSLNNPPNQLGSNIYGNPEAQGRAEEPSTPQDNKSRDIGGNKSKSPSPNDSKKSVHRAESTANESESEWERSYWNEKISPILQALEAAHQDANHEDLCSLCVKLWKTLDDGSMLGKRCKRRSHILKTLYKLVDVGSDRLGLTLAKLILELRVSGKNLLNICKLVFKISRSENNDCLFQSDNMMGVLLEVLQNEDAQANSEAFLYCLGTIKFLSGNTVLLHELLKKQAVEILVELMKQIIQFNAVPKNTSSDMSHLLVQLTATLRNLADLAQSRPKFLATNAFMELCVLLEHYLHDKDICTNVSRILSKLSLYHDCCMALADCSNCYTIFLSVLNKHPDKQDLLVRIIFTLGNLTAKSDTARKQFYEVEGSIKTLLRLLHAYCDLDKKTQRAVSSAKEKPKGQKQPTEVEDVLIKIIRLLANLSVHPKVGEDLAADQNCVLHLMQILEYKSINECEELVIDTLAAFGNLSYYQNDTSVITKRRMEISNLLLQLMLSSNIEGILEATRVYGNLSQYQDVQDFILEQNVYKFIVALLDSGQQEVCFSACGVLINLATDSHKKTLLKEEGALEKLVECLRDFGCSDWQLAGLVCKAFWNFMDSATDAGLYIGFEETNKLLDLLSAYLDEQVALDCRWNVDLMDYQRECWEAEFKPVASLLLDKIHGHPSYLEPLPDPV